MPGDRRLVLADIPGLIEGASDGHGLGHRFLKHVERCRFLIHLVSVDPHTETIKEPIERFLLLQKEVAAFSPELRALPQIAVLSKCDLLTEEERTELQKAFSTAIEQPVICISSATQLGLDELKKRCAKQLHDMLAEEDGEGEDPQ